MLVSATPALFPVHTTVSGLSANKTINSEQHCNTSVIFNVQLPGPQHTSTKSLTLHVMIGKLDVDGVDSRLGGLVVDGDESGLHLKSRSISIDQRA